MNTSPLSTLSSVSLIPRRSLLQAVVPDWERAGEKTPSRYCQNTPDFSVLGESFSVTSQLGTRLVLCDIKITSLKTDYG